MRLYIGQPASEIIPGSYGYALAHECYKDSEMILSYATTKNVILDNGADELGTGMSGGEYIYLLGKISPEYAILPDVLGNGPATVLNGITLLDQVGRVKDLGIKWIGVSQGQDWGEFVETHMHWWKSEDVSVIGIPYDIDFDVPGCSFTDDEEEIYTNGMKRAMRRLTTLERLIEGDSNPKKFHLLGSNDLWEMSILHSDYSHLLPYIESHDTTAPYSATQSGVKFENHDGLYMFGQEKNWAPLDFSQTNWGRELLFYNLDCYLRACRVPKNEYWMYLPVSGLKLIRGNADE